jgi:hypothetical protein
MRINTEQRSNDWIAFLNGDRKKWEAGRTESEAIGRLIISHANNRTVDCDIILTSNPRKSIWLENIV